MQSSKSVARHLPLGKKNRFASSNVQEIMYFFTFQRVVFSRPAFKEGH